MPDEKIAPMLLCALFLYFIIPKGVSASSELASSDFSNEVCFARSSDGESILKGDLIYAIEDTQFTLGCLNPEVNGRDPQCRRTMVIAAGVPQTTGVYFNPREGIIFTSRSLRRQATGNYTIACSSDGSRTFFLEVLYPPKTAEIIGPYTVLKDTAFVLTCHSDSNPTPEYWWKHDTSEETPIASGQSVSIQGLQSEDTWFYCSAQNTMVPTVGNAVSEHPIYLARHVVMMQEPSYIRDLPEEFVAYSGFTISIFCDVRGFPEPGVWWTKQDDDSFRKTGSRLTADNVKDDFAGMYKCHAGNTVRANGSAVNIDVSREVHVKIIAQPDSKDNNADWTLFVAVGSSLIAFSAVLAIAAYFICRKRRKNRKTEDGHAVPLSTIMRDQSERPASEERPNTGTEISWISMCQFCRKRRESVPSPGETVKKSVITDDGGKSDTQCLDLYELL